MATKEHPLEIRPEEREQLVRQAADRRSLYELAEAVREHEARVRRHVGGPRPHDLALYRRLRRVGALRVSGGDKTLRRARSHPTERRPCARRTATGSGRRASRRRATRWGRSSRRSAPTSC